jgi:trehalose 6-phosphate synthase/phosphatase
LDHIKGVLHKLNAFEKFLEDNPDMQDQVVLIQVTSPTEAPSKLETKVSEMVSRINGQYGSLGFAPVHHYHHHIDRDEYYALLSVADVALITSVRDGMNTTSHEYVVCQKNNCGPLILSEFTGTAGSLSAAILVNPWDYVGVAMSIKDALNMSKEEKLMKHTQLYDYVMMNTAKFWAESFMKELIYTSKSIEQSNPTPVLDEDLLLNSFKRSKKRLFLLDYDVSFLPLCTFSLS